jgi:tRNA threonylcarbamoyladenosine biosynthesis protein TsaE
MIIELTSDSSNFTKKIGSLFAKIFNGGDIILLSGELGAGKTTFISGIAEGLGLAENLSSPSFTILSIYRIGNKRKLVHADFYRLNNIDEILNIGIEDYLYDRNSFVCIEWGDRIKDYLKVNYLEIRFDYCLENGRSNSKDIFGGLSVVDQKRQILFGSNNRYWNKKLELFNHLLFKIKK